MESSSDLLKFSAAVQITRPKSAAAHQGFSSSPNSPKQMKVAQLVLKKPIEQSPSPSSTTTTTRVPPPTKSTTRGGFIERSKSDVDRKACNLMTHLTMPKTTAMMTTSKSESKEEVNNGKSAPRQSPRLSKTTAVVVPADESPRIHKSSMANEAVRREAREFMKKQKEKRKQLDETKKEEDKSFIIKQRLAQLKITTRNVIVNANKAPLSKQPNAGANETANSHDVSPLPRHKKYPTYREIHTLKLKPMSRKIQSSSSTTEVMNKSHDEPDDDRDTPPEVEEVLQKKTQCGTAREESEMEVNPKQASASAASFPASPVKKAHTTQPQSLKKLVSPLQLQNHQLHGTTTTKPDVVAQRASVNANRKASLDLKLKIPDVKLNITPLARQEIIPNKMKTPAWLQSSFHQPYPYNFIFAVKKKLEAYISAEELKKQRLAKKQKKTTTMAKKKQKDDSEDMNTMSEISSIQSDLVLMRSQKSSEETPPRQMANVGAARSANEAARNDDDDDTTISFSTLNSVKDELFVGKQRESVNLEFERHHSFPPKPEDDLTIEDISPNTSEKRENFLSSTKIEKSSPPPRVLTFKKPEIPSLQRPQVHQSDNDNHNSSHGKENNYRKMLEDFQSSLTQVIEVNNQLSSSVIDSGSKPSSVTSTTSTAKSYSTLFEKAIDTESSNAISSSHRVNNKADNQESSKLGETSSIETFIDESETLQEKRVVNDPPIIVNETQREVKNNETISQMTSTIVTRDDDDDVKQTFNDNTLNESKILNILQMNDINNISFDGKPNMDNYNEMFLRNNKSTKEIHSWEKKLIDRMKGEIAWLELNKQNLKKHGHFEKAALMRNLQRSLLLRLEKEREKLRNASNSDIIIESSNDNEESVTKSEIERVLEQRENKLNLKRKQIERLVKWQQKLDHEESRLKTIEQQLLGKNLKKISSSRDEEPQRESENDLNISIEKVRSIDRSLEILQNIPSSEDKPEIVKVSGSKLNKLWRRLTGSSTPRFDFNEVHTFTKQKFSELYEEARLFVMHNDFEKVLDVSNLSINNEKESHDVKFIPEKERREDDEVDRDDNNSDDEKSEVSTMNSIANIETEEEYPGSFQDEVIETEVTSSTKKNGSSESSVLLEIPKLDNLTFAITPKATAPQRPPQIDDLNQSNLSVGIGEMEVERDSHQTSSILNSFEKIESSSVDIDGSIIPENTSLSAANIQITDMDESIEQEDQLIEDISFPDYENSFSIQESEPNVRNNLSTITECTEYEQSQGSSEIYTDFGTTTTTTSTSSSSESKNVAIQNRLISINDSLTEVSEAFDRAVKPLSSVVVAKTTTTTTNSTDANNATSSSSPSKSSEENNTIQFSEHDNLRHSTGEEDDKKSESNGSTSDF